MKKVTFGQIKIKGRFRNDLHFSFSQVELIQISLRNGLSILIHFNLFYFAYLPQQHSEQKARLLLEKQIRPIHKYHCCIVCLKLQLF